LFKASGLGPAGPDNQDDDHYQQRGANADDGIDPAGVMFWPPESQPPDSGPFFDVKNRLFFLNTIVRLWYYIIMLNNFS